MRKLAVTLLLIAGAVVGCATQGSHDTLMREAWQEREAAQGRLAKAIAMYCSVGNESLDTRQNCIVEKLLGTLRFEPARADLRSTRVAITPPPPLNVSTPNRLSYVSCERTRFETTCRRIH